MSIFGKITTSILVSVVITIFLALPKNSLATYNLITNPSFEEGSETPTNWIPLNSSNGCNNTSTPVSQLEWDSSLARTGIKSLAIKNINWNQESNNITGAWLSSNFINILPTPQSYEIRSWYLGATQNKNISPGILVCGYDASGNYINAVAGNLVPPNSNSESWMLTKNTFEYFDRRIVKAKILLSTYCLLYIPSKLPCQGSLWFDDVSLTPIGQITAHKFEDLSKDGIQNTDEQNLKGWEMALYIDDNCIDPTNARIIARTDQNGNRIFNKIPYGNYSVKETFFVFDLGPPEIRLDDARTEGWVNTTSICQNVTLDENNPAPVVNFGNVKEPTVPYFSQKDPAWGGQEYDSASTYGPFFCGTTMAGCGCATTSSAMLLKYYGVDTAPNGNPTNPSTLDNWLKTNNGYAFGALKWNSVAAYSVAANTAYGTQKIKFSGVGAANDFSTLNSDLNAEKPAILEEPGHFILGTSVNGATYDINDPFYEDRKTLSSYSNNFLHMLRYEKTNTDLSVIYIQSPAPTDIFLTNSQGQRVGKDPTTGTVYTEIPNSYYYTETSIANQDNPNQANAGQGVTTLIILTPQADTYNVAENNPESAPKIEFTGYDQHGDSSIKNFTIGNPNTPTDFNLNYSPELGTTIKVERQVYVDFLPNSPKNPLSLNNGVRPIAILGSETFDVKDVNIASVTIAKQGKPFKNKEIYLDANHDKIQDLTLFFNPDASGVLTNDSKICLHGQTQNGDLFYGCDTIRVITKGNPFDEIPSWIRTVLKPLLP